MPGFQREGRRNMACKTKEEGNLVDCSPLLNPDKYLLADQAGQRDGHKSLRAGSPALVIEDTDRLVIHL